MIISYLVPMLCPCFPLYSGQARLMAVFDTYMVCCISKYAEDYIIRSSTISNKRRKSKLSIRVWRIVWSAKCRLFKRLMNRLCANRRRNKFSALSKPLWTCIHKVLHGQNWGDKLMLIANPCLQWRYHLGLLHAMAIVVLVPDCICLLLYFSFAVISFVDCLHFICVS